MVLLLAAQCLLCVCVCVCVCSVCCCRTYMTAMFVILCWWLRVKKTSGRMSLSTGRGSTPLMVSQKQMQMVWTFFLCNRRFNFFSDVTLSSFSHVCTYLCDLILVFLDPHIQITTQKRATRPEITWQPPCSLSLDILPVMWFGAQ